MPERSYKCQKIFCSLIRESVWTLIEVAVGFYDALGAGETIKFAYNLSRKLLPIENIPEEIIPKLLGKKLKK
ncbi:hypothetical protein NUACC21_04810 [Scytonema sp. NUACC21]